MRSLCNAIVVPPKAFWENSTSGVKKELFGSPELPMVVPMFADARPDAVMVDRAQASHLATLRRRPEASRYATAHSVNARLRRLRRLCYECTHAACMSQSCCNGASCLRMSGESTGTGTGGLRDLRKCSISIR